MRRFNQVISIILGIVVALLVIPYSYLGMSCFALILDLTAIMLGGFVATYFAKEPKMMYGFCVGLSLVLIQILASIIQGGHLGNYSSLFGAFSIIIILAGIGGLLGEITDKRKQKPI